MKRILSIEDNRANRIMLHDFLTKQGFEIIEAVDGREGIQKAKESKPDLIITDFGLPYMDGFEVLKSLKSDPELKAIPVIMISSETDDKNQKQSLELGCDCYLVKPYDFKEILNNVKKFTD